MFAMGAGCGFGGGAARYTLGVGLQGFERRLERLVEGTFNKAFRSGLQPVEIGHRVTRVLDDGRTLGVNGRPVAPNNIGVYLSPADFERFESFAEALARELAEAARQHARDEGYQFVGPVTVTLVPDDTLKTGDFDVVAEIAEGAGGHVGLARAARRPPGPPRRAHHHARAELRLHGEPRRPPRPPAPRRDPPHRRRLPPRRPRVDERHAGERHRRSRSTCSTTATRSRSARR